MVTSSATAQRSRRLSAQGRAVGSRLLHIVLVLVLVSFSTALLVDFIPGEPAFAVIGESATPDQVAEFNRQTGLDRPLLERYGAWIGNVVTGDLGSSFRTRETVTDALATRLPVTLELMVLALGMALVVAVPLGVYTAWRRRGPLDQTTTFVTSLVIATPVFVLGLFLSYYLSVKLGLFPVTGYRKLSNGLGENLQYIFLPALTMALPEIAVFTRLLRADMVSTLQEDHILAARAAGLPSRTVLWKYALKPSSFTLLTLAGLSVGRLLGGAVIIERIFGLPGMGSYLFESISSKDFMVVQAVVLLIAVAYVLINALIDGLYHVLDPRLRTRKA